MSFGGGHHRCIGSIFALQQIKIIWSIIFRRFELSLIRSGHQPDYPTFVVGPRAPCRVRYRRRRRVAIASDLVPAIGSTGKRLGDRGAPRLGRGAPSVGGLGAISGPPSVRATPPSFAEAHGRREKACAAGLSPDYWYPVEYDRRVRKGQVVEVAFWNRSIALYRGVDGVLRALENRCAQQARDVLTAAVQRDEPPAALILLARTWFLIGEIHARTDAERLAAYEQGRDAGRRAVAAAPQRADAHLWYAINLGRWAEARGVLRAAMALSAVKEEVDLVLRLDPRSVEDHALAGSLAAELPGFLGGSLRRAEEEFRRALELDPRRASVRVELAGLYVETKRYADARRELRRALEEPAPSDLPYWTIRMLPRAQSLLESIRDK
jgi:tetratricopeptide (TPR) repeat protein